MEVFNLLDRKGEGFLTSDKLGVALRSVGLRLTNSQIGELKNRAESEFEAGKIDFEGFKDYIFEGQKIQKTDDELEAAFKVFDNGEGEIEIDNFRHALSSLGDKMSLEEIDEIIHQARQEYGEDDRPGFIKVSKLLK